MRRTAALTLVAALVLGVASPAQAAGARDLAGTCAPVSGNPFSDVAAENAHAQGVVCIQQWQITVGRTDGTYGPAEAVTRGQMASFLRNLLDAASRPVAGAGGSHEANFTAMRNANILPASNSPDFLTTSISRGEMTTWMTGTFAYATGSAPSDADPTQPYPFKDVPAGATYRNDALQLWAAGVVTGVTSDELRPATAVSRGQMASFLARLIDYVFDPRPATSPSGPFEALSPGAQDRVREAARIFGRGRLIRWAPGTIRVSVTGQWSPGAIEAATSFWDQRLSDLGVHLVVVEPDELADVRFDTAPQRPTGTQSDGCGLEGPTAFDGDTITAGSGTYWKVDPCYRAESYAPDWDRTALTHGLGHVLGLGHSPSGADLMGSPESALGSSPELDEAVRWIYSQPAGTVPG